METWMAQYVQTATNSPKRTFEESGTLLWGEAGVFGGKDALTRARIDLVLQDLRFEVQN